MSKIPTSDLNNCQILPYIRRGVFLESQGLTSLYSVMYILYLEMNFGSLY